MRDPDGAVPGELAAAWLAVPEAARATGWNPERLRSLARRGTITSRRGNRGLEILVEAGRPRSRDGQPQPDGRPAAATAESGREGDRIARLEATVDRLREDLAAADREVSELRVELARAEERAKAVEAVARGDVEAAKRVVEAEIAAQGRGGGGTARPGRPRGRSRRRAGRGAGRSCGGPGGGGCWGDRVGIGARSMWMVAVLAVTCPARASAPPGGRGILPASIARSEGE